MFTNKLKNDSNEQTDGKELPLPTGFQSEIGGHGTPSLIDIVACPNHQRCAGASMLELGSMKEWN
jgi:hypothetical protein